METIGELQGKFVPEGFAIDAFFKKFLVLAGGLLRVR